jgi:regulator of ribonuclease activity A
MNISTADISDNHREKVKATDPIFKDFGARKNFWGEIVTLKIFEDNSFVRKMLAEDGTGKVLVIDGGGSMRCALLGDQLGELAVKNDWVGVVIFGCLRDSEALGTMPLGIKALGTHPFKTEKRNEGQENLSVSFAGVTFTPGEYIYCDADGILVSAQKLDV